MASLAAVGQVFSHRNARIFYAGSLTSWTGLWMQKIATDWLTWQLTHSALWVGIMAFCNLGPSVIASPIAGAVADRMDRVRLTVFFQFVSASHAAILVALIVSGLIRVGVISLWGMVVRGGPAVGGAGLRRDLGAGRAAGAGAGGVPPVVRRLVWVRSRQPRIALALEAA